MSSLFLNKMTPDERHSLIQRLHNAQSGRCFICDQLIDLKLHADSLDIDHVEPLKVGGKDGEENFALTHASCNRSKQASDLRVARVLARFERIRRNCAEEGRGPNLADVLGEYGGAKYELVFEAAGSDMRLTFDAIGQPEIKSVPCT
jgi:HNH endonuclease